MLNWVRSVAERRSSKLIVHCISSTRLDRGGPSLSATQLLQSHRQAGQEGWLLCPDHDYDSQGHAPVETVCMPSTESLIATVPRSKIRAFHLHGIWDLFLHDAVSVARKHGIPYVISPRGMLEPWALSQKKWKKRLAWWLYQRNDLQRAALLVATATSEADQFQRLGLVNPSVVVPNGVPLPAEDFDSIGRPSSDSAGVKTALFLSRIHPKKGLLMLANAWARVRPEGWRMLVVGPDQDGHLLEVQRCAEELGLTSTWEFRDAVYGPDKRRIFLEADLFVLPTFSENFGIAIAEALAYGLPVITTDQAPWEGLIEHRCGWRVRADVLGISEALSQATALTRADLQTMGQRGSQWVRNEFSWPTIARRMIEAYDIYVP